MPGIGKNHLLVDIIHRKTKIKKRDIADIFKVLPASMAEAFIIADPDQKTSIELGGIELQWRQGGMWGTILSGKMNIAFKKALIKLKVEQKHPFAIKLFKLMNPVNQKRAVDSYNSKNTTT